MMPLCANEKKTHKLLEIRGPNHVLFSCHKKANPLIKLLRLQIFFQHSKFELRNIKIFMSAFYFTSYVLFVNI